MSVSGKPHGDRASSGKGKFQAVNINSQFAGKSLVAQKSGPARHGLQSLGKQSAVVRRLPPPANLPSLKAESSGQDPTVNLVPSGGPGWGNQEPPTDSNAQAQQHNYQKGAQSISSGHGGGGSYGGGVQSAVGGTTRGPPPPSDTHKTGWSSRVGGEGDQAFFSQSARDFPSLEASGDAKPAGESGVPSLRPQKFGSWKSGGGGVGSKGFSGGNEADSSSPTAHSPSATEQISPAPRDQTTMTPGMPSMDHPPHHHYPGGAYPQRMYPGQFPPGPGGMPPPRGYPPGPPPPGYGGMPQGGMYPAYGPPRPGPGVNGGQYPPPRGYSMPRGGAMSPQQPHSGMYDGRYPGGGSHYGPPVPPPPGRDYHQQPPRDMYSQPHDDYHGGVPPARGRPPPLMGNGMDRTRAYNTHERDSDRMNEERDYRGDYNEGDRVVWSDDEGAAERGNRHYDRPGNREPDSWSDPETENYHDSAGARGPHHGHPAPQQQRNTEYNDYGDRAGPPAPQRMQRGPPPGPQRGPHPAMMGYPPRQGDGRGYGPPPADYYHPQQHMPPASYPMEGRRYPPQAQMPPRGPPMGPGPSPYRDIRDIDDEEDEERRRQLQQNAEREAAIEKSRQQRRLAPQSSLTSSTGASESGVQGDIGGGRGRPDSADYEHESDLERPSSRDELGKGNRKAHTAVPPRFQRQTDGAQTTQVPSGRDRRPQDQGSQRPLSRDHYDDPYAHDYYGGAGRRNGGDYDSDRQEYKERGSRHQPDKYANYSSHHTNKRRDDQRGDRRDDYRKKDRAVSEEKENDREVPARQAGEKLKRHESKDSLSSGGGKSSEKSYDRKSERSEKPKEQKPTRSWATIEGPAHPATVREEDNRPSQERIDDDDEDEAAPMQVLSKPAIKVIKRTAGGSTSSSGRKSTESRGKSGGHSEKPSSQKPSSTQQHQQSQPLPSSTPPQHVKEAQPPAVDNKHQIHPNSVQQSQQPPVSQQKAALGGHSSSNQQQQQSDATVKVVTQSSAVEQQQQALAASFPPAKNVWEQRKEERESQEREANKLSATLWQPQGIDWWKI